ncbi:FAD-dependent thymidylate synthase [Candidatus Sneabacter namystus]|uniref:Flavin-dependent thymidylate synthase n=1 Tax=Candidatus Sneabacter namystus TaxID=2601646 RepID=A0A5C0UIX5_9RICK|nr:FAD-dependent thymidylate synthase [Candidatus Sneabacter namystus]QEK39700.1 FAD-dependent thymidylate synthase [Candidatus Sneabacter namystus]
MLQDLILDQEEEDLYENTTKRDTSIELEKILYKKIKVLDHGFIRVIDYMGSDSAIVQAARVSYGHGTKKVSQDKALINYLVKHRHTSPLEMCEIKFHIKLPIFIARQWIRHRTANVNEYSARYSVLDKEFYLPEREILCAQSSSNKQGRHNEPLTKEETDKILHIIKTDSERCYDNYSQMLNTDIDGNVVDDEKTGLARELARMNLNLNYYTQWYWKIDLHNLLHFISLRYAQHAQYEIREYAKILLEIIKLWLPHVYEAFMEYRHHGAELSKSQIQALKKFVDVNKISKKESGLKEREWQYLIDILS